MRARLRNTSISIVLVLVLLLSISLPLWAAEIVILHTNDVHSRVESHLPEGGRKGAGRSCEVSHVGGRN